MGTTFAYMMDAEELQNFANKVKEILLQRMDAEGHLATGSEELVTKYAVVVHKPGFLGKLLERVQDGKPDPERLTIRIVKIV
jgi:hypothetical protein